MYHNYSFEGLSSALPVLLDDILDGDEVSSRNGRVRELTHVGILYENPLDRWLVLPERKANIAAQIAETAWVLAGRNDIEFLSHYLSRAADFSDDGNTWRAGYGPRIRKWGGKLDQLAAVLDILREDPLSRRAVIGIWDPAWDLQEGRDIACNNWISFSSRLGEIDLHVAVRSNDIIWGHSGINMFEWSVLLEVSAGLLGMAVGGLHFSVTSLHLYEQHFVRAEKIARDGASNSPLETKRSPRFDASKLPDRTIYSFDRMLEKWFELEKEIRTKRDGSYRKAISEFPEPMFRSWLNVLDWWWTASPVALDPIAHTGMQAAAYAGVQPKPVQANEIVAGSSFIEEAIKLHNEKHAAYGDSWKKRGEAVSILANIARKIDRIGGAETSDETSADTALDTMVYLAKYSCWLSGKDTDTPDTANALLREIDARKPVSFGNIEKRLKSAFESLLEYPSGPDTVKEEFVELMLVQAYVLAERLWSAENRSPNGETYDDDEYRGADFGG